MKSMKALILVASLVCVPAFAASDIFIKLGDIKGESTDQSHRDWIAASSFSWGMRGPAVQRASTPGCSTGEIRFAVVKLTPQLVQGCQTNAHLPQVTIDFHGERHVLQGAQIRSCQNNLITVHFDRCATHPAAPLAASVLNPNALTTNAPNGQIKLGNEPSESLNLLGLRKAGSNGLIILQRGASAGLMRSCATGKHFPAVSLTCRKAGKGQQEYLVVKLTDVIITSVSPNADGSTSLGMKYASMQGSVDGLENLQ